MPADAKQSCRILIVENDPYARRALAALLTLGGHEVTATASAQEAIDLLGARPPFTHVLLDLMLGQTEGTGVLAQLREMRHGARVGIISSTNDEELIARAQAFEPERFFVKPLEIERLLEWLKSSR